MILLNKNNKREKEITCKITKFTLNYNYYSYKYMIPKSMKINHKLI